MVCSPISFASRSSARSTAPPPKLIRPCCAPVACFAIASSAGSTSPRQSGSPRVSAGHCHWPVIIPSLKCLPDIPQMRLTARILGLRLEANESWLPPMTITSIDFETANQSRVSICAAGIAVFENGNLTESLHWLVRPPKGKGWFLTEFTENCHGLTWFDVQDAPEFPAIATELLVRLTRADIVIAHNAQFDIGALQATLDHFGLACPEFDYLCTYRVAERIWPELPNHQLNTLAAQIGHEFPQHHAQ